MKLHREMKEMVKAHGGEPLEAQSALDEATKDEPLTVIVPEGATIGRFR